MKKQINNIFLICLLGILFSFTQNILNSFKNDKENLAIELAEEQDDEENRESKENKENKEKSETEIDDFLEHNFLVSISSFFTSINLTNYSIGNYSSNTSDLTTPPPKTA